MATITNDPATRGDIDGLRAELRDHYATMADLVGLKADLRGDALRLALSLAALQLAGLGAVAAIIRFAGG